MSIHTREMQKRRKKLMTLMKASSIALLAAASPKVRKNDAEFLYRQNSDFYYLTGFSDRDAVLALIPGRKEGEVVLFCQEKDKQKELWTGIILGQKAAIDELGVDEALSIRNIDEVLPELIAGRDHVYYAIG